MLLLLLIGGFTLVAGKVPEHEIVYPRMIISRSGEKRLMFRAFEKDFHLRLEPTNILSDDFVLITRSNNEVAYMKPDVERFRNSILQDPAMGTTVSVEESGPLQVKGIINEELRIEPDPSFHASPYKGKHGHGHGHGHGGHGRNHGGDHKGQIYDKFNRGKLAREIPHRVTKVIPRTDGGYFDEIIPPGIKGENSSNSDAESRQGKKIIVETAFVCDRALSLKLRNDNECVRHVTILMNSVAMRFKTMARTDIEFKLCKLKRNLVPEDEPYITKNMYSGHVLSDALLEDFATYVYNNKEFASADLVNLICGQPMGDIDDSTGKIDPGVAGIAYVGGVCEKRYKCSASEEIGDFDGCSTVAHEIAHLLGAPHDGDDPVSYIPGSPGAKQCSWSEGYLMSYIRNNEKQFAFSQCSENCLLQLLSQRSCDCVYRKDMNDDLNVQDNRLPGQYFGEAMGTYNLTTFYNKRCYNRRSDLTCYKTAQNGCQYSCRSPTNVNRTFYIYNYHCLDGDPCGPSQMCRSGYCNPY